MHLSRRQMISIPSCGFLRPGDGKRSKDQQSKISAYIGFVVAILSLYAVGKQLREC